MLIMSHNLKIDVDSQLAKAVAAAVYEAIQSVGFDGLLATSMFPNASKRKVHALAA